MSMQYLTAKLAQQVSCSASELQRTEHDYVVLHIDEEELMKSVTGAFSLNQ